MKNVKRAFQLFEVVNKHFRNEDDTKVLITEIEEIMNDKLAVTINDLATKKDLSDLALQLRSEMSGLSAELRSEMSALSKELRSEMAALSTELRADMSQLRLDTQKDIAHLASRMEHGFKEQLKWTIGLMIGFFSATIAATIAVVKLG